MNLLTWRPFSSFGEAGVIAGTTPAGAGRVGTGAVFAGVAAWAGADQQDGTVGADRGVHDLVSTGQAVTGPVSTDQVEAGQASIGQVEAVPAATDRGAIVQEAIVPEAAARQAAAEAERH